jgi:hypothetical protein
MTELERSGKKLASDEEPARLPSGHLAPVRLQGRPSPRPTGWSPTAWQKSGKDRR